ncbi:hypothetical protein LOD99_13706 [Oopsacas minuta]|uniref:Uncharacterized protein n=1 Tax=Oopsacas minuta TaxID=111878 RepID=A0AAV7KJK7_9METZ|nr:hypothetical protein LOD99_13706 [Oopsacas minuta]
MTVFCLYYQLLIIIGCFLITPFGAPECNEALLEKVIKDNNLLRGFVLNNNGAPEANLASELPLIGSTNAWTLRYGGNELEYISPLFVLHEEAPGTPHFWLTGIGIQNGFQPGSSCGSPLLSDNSYITKLKVTTGSKMNMTEYVSIQAPYTDDIDPEGDPILNLKQLGLNNRGRLIKINFPPVAVDEIKLQIIETSQPSDPNVTNYVCLRVEFYGCRRDLANPDEPDINNGVLLQYIMPSTDALIDGYQHEDSNYTGVESMGLLSGGVGVLADGTLGDTPLLSPEEYFGWSVCGTPNPYIILLFNNKYLIVNLITRIWRGDIEDIGAMDNAFKVYDQNDTLLEFDGENVFNVSFLKIEFSYPTDSMLLLLSEVRIVTENKLDLVTGSNLTQLLVQISNNTNTITVTMANTTIVTMANTTTVTMANTTTTVTTTTSTNTQTPTPKPAASNATDDTPGSFGNIFVITTGVLSFIVIILLIIIVILAIVLICCFTSKMQKDETKFYNNNENNSNSYGLKRSDEHTMESIRSNDARVGGDNVELSESQVYL